MSPVRPFVPLLAALALAASGCGDDEPEAPSTASPPPATTTATVTATTSTVPRPGTGAGATANASPPSAAEDRRIAVEGRLEPGDLPEGTKEEPSDDAVESPCAAIEAAKRSASAREPARDFALSGDIDASHAVYVYGDEARASDAFGDLGSPATRRCIGAALRTELTRTLRTDGIRVVRVRTRTARVPDLGGQSGRVQIRMDLRAKGRTQPAYAEIVTTRIGRVLSISTVASGKIEPVRTFATAAAEKVARTVRGG